MAGYENIPTGQTSVRLTLNGTDYSARIREGFVINETLSESLDSLNLVIVDIQKTLFEPFQEAQLRLSNGQTFYFVVNTQMEEVSDSVRGTFNYTINLVSKTKMLERIILPNLKITKRRISRSIKWYLENVVLKYIHKKYLSIYLGESINDFANVKVPEMQWENPSAKKVINDLLLSVNGKLGVCKVVGNKIEYIDLNKKRNDVSALNYTSDLSYESMSDYSNSVILDAKNIVQTKEVTSTPELSARTNGARLTTDNAKWIVPNARFDKVISLFVTSDFNYRDSSNKLVKGRATVDLSNSIVEKSVYDSKYSYNFINTGDFKEHYLYYYQNGNTIEGLTESYPVGNVTLYVLISEKLMEMGYNVENVISDIRQVTFKVSFINVGDTKLEIFKDEEEQSKVSVLSGQNQSYVDYQSLTKAQRQSVNQMGNEQMVRTGIFRLDECPQLCDYIGDFTLSEREIAVYEDFVIFKGTFVKNYAQKNNYYGLQNRRRFTLLAQANDSIVREDLNEMLVRLSHTKKNDNSLNEQYLSTFMTKFYYHGQSPIAVIETFDENNNSIKKFFLQTYVYGGDRITTMTGQCEDNINVGMKIDIKSGEKYHEWQSMVKYTDNNGEIASYRFQITEGIGKNIGSGGENTPFVYPEYNSTYTALNEVNGTGFHHEYYKDNSETLKVTYQFEFISEDESIVIGDAIGMHNRLVSKDSSEYEYMLVFSPYFINKKYPALVGGGSLFIAPDYYDFSVEDGGLKIELNSEGHIYLPNDPFDNPNYKSFAICSSTNEIVFAVNRIDNNFKNKIYFNCKERG